jgi:hypothetical protein
LTNDGPDLPERWKGPDLKLLPADATDIRILTVMGSLKEKPWGGV